MAVGDDATEADGLALDARVVAVSVGDSSYCAITGAASAAVGL